MSLAIEVLAYAAGVMDSDGTVGVTRHAGATRRTHYSIYVSVSTKGDEMPLWFSSVFGGKVLYKKPSSKAGNERFVPLWRWRLDGKKAGDFLKLVVPHLKLKQPRAILAIRLAEMTSPHGWQNALRDSRGWILPVPEAIAQERETLAIEIRQANKRGRVA